MYSLDKMIHFIDNIEDSIGFGPLDVAKTHNLNLIKIDGKAPSDNDYPSYGILALIYKQENFKDDLQKFVDFTLSEPVKSVIINAGGIPL